MCGGGQEPPPTSVSAARPVCGPVDKIPQLLYSSPTRYLEILLPNATSGGRGLLPQEADDTSRFVEAGGRETTASPFYPQGGWHGAAKPREGRGVRAQRSSSIGMSMRAERYGFKSRNGQVIFERDVPSTVRRALKTSTTRQTSHDARGESCAAAASRGVASALVGAPSAPAACDRRARQAVGPFHPPTLP